MKMPITRAAACDNLEPFVVSIGLSGPDYFKRVVLDDEQYRKIPMQVGSLGPMDFTKHVDPHPLGPVQAIVIYTNAEHDARIQCDTYSDTYFSHCDATLEVPIDDPPRRSMIVYLQRKPELLNLLVRQVACTRSQIHYVVMESAK